MVIITAVLKYSNLHDHRKSKIQILKVTLIAEKSELEKTASIQTKLIHIINTYTCVPQNGTNSCNLQFNRFCSNLLKLKWRWNKYLMCFHLLLYVTSLKWRFWVLGEMAQWSHCGYRLIFTSQFLRCVNWGLLF